MLVRFVMCGVDEWEREKRYMSKGPAASNTAKVMFISPCYLFRIPGMCKCRTPHVLTCAYM